MWIEAPVLDILFMIPMFKTWRLANARIRFSNYHSHGHLTRLILS